MLKILCGKSRIPRAITRNIRKYTEGGCRNSNKPDYDCPHQKKKLTWFEQRQLMLKSYVHPFLRKECKHNANIWKNIFLFICIPCIIAAAVNFKYFVETPKRPPFIEYSHLRIRKRSYPWRDGVKSLFHNPERNALPTGYETESEDEDDD